MCAKGVAGGGVSVFISPSRKKNYPLDTWHGDAELAFGCVNQTPVSVLEVWVPKSPACLEGPGEKDLVLILRTCNRWAIWVSQNTGKPELFLKDKVAGRYIFQDTAKATFPSGIELFTQ